MYVDNVHIYIYIWLHIYVYYSISQYLSIMFCNYVTAPLPKHISNTLRDAVLLTWCPTNFLLLRLGSLERHIQIHIAASVQRPREIERGDAGDCQPTEKMEIPWNS